MPILKGSLDTPSFEKEFIRRALCDGIRLDGRRLSDNREVTIHLSRNELRSIAEVLCGKTRVICNIIGEVVAPYPDRPSEGILTVNTQVSIATEKAGITKVQLTRTLERLIKDSDTLDLESLCILSGDKVWSIRCDVTVLDYDGNVTDTASLAVMAALRSYRKPEVSVTYEQLKRNNSNSTQTHTEISTTNKSSQNLVMSIGIEDNNDNDNDFSNTITVPKVHIYHSDERESLPLALHHTPLSISIGYFKDIQSSHSSSSSSNNSSSSHNESESSNGGSGSTGSRSDVTLIADPLAAEELAMDGVLLFSINAHKELCSIHKPGGVGLQANVILQAASIASRRAPALQKILSEALMRLEEEMTEQRAIRLQTLKTYKENERQEKEKEKVSSSMLTGGSNAFSSSPMEGVVQGIEDMMTSKASIGIDRNDAILDYNRLHQASVSIS